MQRVVNIESIEKQLEELGQVETPIDESGKIVRFAGHNKPKHDKSLAYVIHIYSGKKGVYKFLYFWDWSSGEHLRFCEPPPGQPMNPTLIKKVVKEQVETIASQQSMEQEAAAKKANISFAQLKENTVSPEENPYIQRKGIASFKDDNGAIITKDKVFIPCIDRNRNLWGYQTVFADGKKYFYPSQRIKGTFYLIRQEKNDVIFITEGYATGVTIAMATGKTVFVAYNTTNLPNVAKQALVMHPEARIVIAADNDIYKGENNPGVEWAKKAAEKTGAKIAVPNFTKIENCPTDFNDLQVYEGIEEVRKQLGEFIKTSSSAEPNELFTSKPYIGDPEEETTILEIAKRFRERYSCFSTADEVVYLYKENHWVEASKLEILSICSKLDSEEKDIHDRRLKVYNQILADSFLPPEAVKWRSLLDEEIPFMNGVYNMNNETLHPHKKEQFLTAVIPWAYNESAKCPTFLKILDDYFGGDDRVQALQQFFGYVMMPHAKYKKALLAFGEPHTGKSVIAKILRNLVGQKNVCSIGVQNLGDDRKLAPIKDKMVNIVTEIASGEMLADAGFKQLVSGEDDVQLDQKYKRAEMYRPFCKHAFFTNVMPTVKDESEGTWERLLVIVFDKVIQEKDRDPLLEQKLLKEMPGIAQWALMGAHMLWAQHGQFSIPSSTVEIIRQHRLENDPVLCFLDEFCRPVNPASNFNPLTFNEMMEMINKHRPKALSKQFLGKRLKKHGIETVKRGGSPPYLIIPSYQMA